MLRLLLFFSLLFLLLSLLILYRLRQTIPGLRPPRPSPSKDPNSPRPEVHVLIVLGSGGHTAEMLQMLSNALLPSSQTNTDSPSHSKATDLSSYKYSYRTYIVSEGDSISASKAAHFEAALLSQNPSNSSPHTHYRIITVPRARQIYQSLLTTPLSCLRTYIACLAELYRLHRPSSSIPPPKLLLLNGPATSLIVLLASLTLSFFAPVLPSSRSASPWVCRSIYVESWARVYRLSLTGKIIVKAGLCDRVIVQWERLAGILNQGNSRRRVEYLGVLVA